MAPIGAIIHKNLPISDPNTILVVLERPARAVGGIKENIIVTKSPTCRTLNKATTGRLVPPPRLLKIFMREKRKKRATNITRKTTVLITKTGPRLNFCDIFSVIKGRLLDTA